MYEIKLKFYRESHDSAVAQGYSLNTDAMGDVDNLTRPLAINIFKNKLSETSSFARSYRGITATMPFIRELNYFAKNNSTVKTDQFLSTSASYSVARNFSSGKYSTLHVNGDRPVIFNIEGTSGAYIQAYIKEDEILYPPETHFQISHASFPERALFWGGSVFNLKEVAPHSNAPFLTDMGKIQRMM